MLFMPLAFGLSSNTILEEWDRNEWYGYPRKLNTEVEPDLIPSIEHDGPYSTGDVVERRSIPVTEYAREKLDREEADWDIWNDPQHEEEWRECRCEEGDHSFHGETERAHAHPVHHPENDEARMAKHSRERCLESQAQEGVEQGDNEVHD